MSKNIVPDANVVSDKKTDETQKFEKAEKINQVLSKKISILNTEIFLKIIIFIAVIIFLILSCISQGYLLLKYIFIKIPLEKEILEAYWKFFSTITASFTVIFTAIVIGIFKLKAPYIKDFDESTTS